jgi:putative phosphoribosyl transferase
VSFRFQDRAEAGRFLADKLQAYAGRSDVVILGLPRGGIPVAFEVARKLPAPLAAFLVRKLGVPGHEELAMGAIASGGVCYLNEQVLSNLAIPERVVGEAIEREQRELERRGVFCKVAPLPELRGRIIILIDDGLATGASMHAAVNAARQTGPARLVVAVPVAARDVYDKFKSEADEIVCVQTPDQFDGVGQWYEDFTQTTDEEARDMLLNALKFRPDWPGPP